MPRYIKDGAYTIVIEDAKTPKRPKSQDGESGGAESQQDGDESYEEEEEEEEVINFASPEFMLQNLDIANITYQSDKTFMLKARNEIAELISIQACYYTYIALQPYVHRADPPSILLMGDGYIGSKVAYKLAEHGCKQYLKIFSRGEFGSKEWRKQGFTCSSSLQHLLKKSKPSVLLLCTDYTSVYMIFHQLQELELLSSEMFVIVCTLGAQRKKVYYNFSSPSVFRCFVEPQIAIRRLKTENGAALLSSKDAGDFRPPSPPASNIDTTGLRTMMDSVLGALNEEGEEYMQSTLNKPSVGEESQDESSVEEDIPTTPIEKAARLVIERTPEVVKFIHLVENYYCNNNISPEEARRMALRTVVGYVETTQRPQSSTSTDIASRPGSRGRRRLGSSRRKPAITVKAIENLLLSLYMEIGRAFHREFSKLITMQELIVLAEQTFVIVDEDKAEAENSKELYTDNHGKHHMIKIQIQRGTKSIYERSYIHAIFAVDDAVYDNPGASFDYIRSLDESEEKK